VAVKAGLTPGSVATPARDISGRAAAAAIFMNRVLTKVPDGFSLSGPPQGCAAEVQQSVDELLAYGLVRATHLAPLRGLGIEAVTVVAEVRADRAIADDPLNVSVWNKAPLHLVTQVTRTGSLADIPDFGLVDLIAVN